MPHRNQVPTYRLHRQSGQAVLTLSPMVRAAAVTCSWANMLRPRALRAWFDFILARFVKAVSKLKAVCSKILAGLEAAD